MRKIRRLLVTGGAGFMGSDFIRYLLGLKNEARFEGTLVNLDLLTYASNLQNVAVCEADSRYQFVRGDISDEKLIKKLFEHYQFDAVVHFAAETHVDRSIEDPDVFVQTNIVGTQVLLEAIRKNLDCHFHLISTDEVYGELSKTGLFTENSPYAPSSPYSASKASSDLLTLSYVRTFGISAVISHATNNFGPMQHKEKLIPKMIRAALANQPMEIYGKGENIRHWIFVRDHSIAVWQLLQNGKARGIYNIAGVTEKSNLEVVEEIAHLVAEKKHIQVDDLKKLISYTSDRPGHDFRYALDGTKIKEDIGFVPKTTFTEGLRQTIEGILKYDKSRLHHSRSSTLDEIS